MPEYVHALLASMLAAGPQLNVDVKRHKYQLTELLRRPFFANVVSLAEKSARHPEKEDGVRAEIDEQLRLMAFLMHQLATYVDDQWHAAGLSSSALAQAIIAATEGVLTGPTA